MTTNQKCVCQACGDNYSNENYELGVCCGLPMVYVDKTVQDLEDVKIYEDTKASILKAAAKLPW